MTANPNMNTTPIHAQRYSRRQKNNSVFLQTMLKMAINTLRTQPALEIKWLKTKIKSTKKYVIMSVTTICPREPGFFSPPMLFLYYLSANATAFGKNLQLCY